MSTMLRIQMRMTVQKYISNICSNNSSSIHQVLCLHSSKSRHSRWSPHLESPSMEDNSNKQLGGCLQVGVLMLEPHLVTAVKMLSEELVDLHMVWLQRVEIYWANSWRRRCWPFLWWNIIWRWSELSSTTRSLLIWFCFLIWRLWRWCWFPFRCWGRCCCRWSLCKYCFRFK